MRPSRRGIAVVVALAAVLAVPVASARAPRNGAPPQRDATAFEHLRAIVERSPAPEYRRYGSAGGAAVADYEAAALRNLGYATVEVHTPADRWWVDYSPGHEPLLERVDDGARFPAESGFELGATTGPDGVTCTVRPYDRVGPGDCGFVPFDVASPAWNNFLSDGAGDAVAQVAARGGVAAIVQGDVAAGALIALRLRAPIPSVVAVVAAGDVVGRTVRVRAMGSRMPATTNDVVAVRRPTSPGRGVVLVLAHADGWFDAAADNGGGVAAALRAAALLGHRAGVAFALVDGEEVGYHGVRGIVDRLRSPGGLDVGDGGPPLRMGDITTVVNLDVPSARASDLGSPPLISWRVLVFTDPDVLLGAQFAATFAAHGVLGLPIPATVADEVTGGLGRTDAQFFAERGVPVVWPVTGYPEYHRSDDDLDTVDPVDLEAVAKATADLVAQLAA